MKDTLSFGVVLHIRLVRNHFENLSSHFLLDMLIRDTFNIKLSEHYGNK